VATSDLQGSLFDLEPEPFDVGPDLPDAGAKKPDLAAVTTTSPVRRAEPPTGAPVVAATDGSCHPNPGPAAGAWYVGPHCWGVAPVTGLGTNNIGELSAIRALLEAVPAEHPLEIVFDSTYARDCLTVWIKAWSRGGTLPPSAWTRGPKREPVKNAELIADTAALLVGRTVIWTKAKAHVAVSVGGHALNHEADRLAGDAVASLRAGTPVALGPGWTRWTA